MNVLDLFSGIGGFSLGLERAGMRTVAFCEIDPFARRVIAKHWPDVPCYDDVRSLTAERLAADGIAPVDVICGGFPCQDISFAGKGAGLAGERSGLWREYARIISEFRPRYVVVENVAALLSRGLDRVLGDLASLGYDAEWHCIPASAVGAPHRRDRVWIVAYPEHDGRDVSEVGRGIRAGKAKGRLLQPKGFCDASEALADANSELRSQRDSDTEAREQTPLGHYLARYCLQGRWEPEPDVGRVAHGIPNRAHRLRALGNAVVPQIPEIIGRAIMSTNREL
jgi:DNA (cytosine-5)-methyltransferase 1